MQITLTLINRNIKLFFRDKGLFFTSLITPVILLVLYIAFLGGVYRDSFVSAMPIIADLPETILEGLVGAQLVSSLISVSCITVSFCSNFLMVQDKANGTLKDLRITPTSQRRLCFCYYLASLISSFMVIFFALALCFIYLAIIGWYMSFADVLLTVFDAVLLVLFGTALSSVINHFLSSQGQISAVGSIVSSCYGFICGAYMPLSQFGEGLRGALSFFPGIYGTSLLRNHTMGGVLSEMSAEGISTDAIEILRDSVDCNVYFFGSKVSEPIMYLVLFGSVLMFLGIYVVMTLPRGRGKRAVKLGSSSK